MPLTEAGRQRGLTWDAALLTMPEHQCKPHPSTYGYRGIGGPRIDRIVDPKNFSVIALTMHIPWMEQRRIVWLDGRPHPPEYAAHTWQGFSTGRWEGETLVVDTTHLKAGWIRRNGLALSDKATMREYFIRHGNTLTHTYVISDPYYLSEPLIKTSGFQLANNDNLAPYPCQAVEEVDRPAGVVPSYLPGKNPYQEEFAKRYNLPLKGVLGGAETALPEFVRGMDTSASMSGRSRARAARPWRSRLACAAWRSWRSSALAPARRRRAAGPRRHRRDQGPCTSRARSTCSSARAPTSSSASATTACWWWTAAPPACRRSCWRRSTRCRRASRSGSIVNTHYHPDHTGGNETIAKSGGAIVAGNFAQQINSRTGGGGTAFIFAHENTLRHFELAPAGQTAPPVGAWPTDVFFGKRKDFSFNGEAVVLMFEPNAHTDGDILVHFRGSDVVAAGDVYINTSYPDPSIARAAAASTATWRR